MELSRSPEVGKSTPGVVPFLGQLSTGQSGEQQGEITSPANAQELPSEHANVGHKAARAPVRPTLTNTPELIIASEDHVPQVVIDKIVHSIERNALLGMRQIPEEVDMTRAEKAVFTRTGQAIVDLANRAKIDLHITPDSVHMVPDNDAYDKARARTNRAPGSRVAYVDHNDGMVVNRQTIRHFISENPHELDRVATHEYMHLSEKLLILTGTPYSSSGKLSYYRPMQYAPSLPAGMHPQKNTGALVEAIAEMGSFNALRRFGEDERLSLRQHYEFPVIFLDAMVSEAAVFHGMEPEEVENSLYQLTMGGNPEALEVITEGLGMARFEALWTLPLSRMSWSEAGNALRTLQSDQAVQNANLLYKYRMMPPLFAWQRGASTSLLPHP